MKIKFPKKLFIASYTFKVITKKEEGGGSFNFQTGIITIGTKYLKDDQLAVFNVIMHEVSEAIHCALNTRYDDESVHGNYKFFMDHKEFQTHNMLLTKCMTKFIK